MTSKVEAARRHTRPPSGVSRFSMAALCATALWLAYRVYWIAERPAVLGLDSYTRMFNREELVVSLMGRKWMPLLQSCVNAIYSLGGTADEVQTFMAFVGTGLILCAALYLYRLKGPVEAILVALLLSVNMNIMWINASPYQEALFYIFAFAVLLQLRTMVERADRGDPGLGLSDLWRPVLWLIPGLTLAILARYEGILLALAVAVSIGIHWWRDRELRAPVPYIALAALFVALPFVGVLAFTSLQDARSSFVIQGIKLEHIAATLEALWVFFADPRMFFWFAIGLVPIFSARARPWQWPAHHIATGLFLVGFVIVFLILSPFAPVTNSRFHVPIVLAILGCASAGVPILLRAVGKGLSDARYRALTAVLFLLFFAHIAEVWSDTRTSMAKRSLNKEREAAIGRAVNRQVERPAPIFFAWNRGDYFGHPDLNNMKITAYVAGPTSRFRFLDGYLALDPVARDAWLRESAGILIDSKHLQRETIRELLLRSATVHGDEFLRADLPKGIGLFTWSQPTTDPQAFAYPPQPVRISELLR